MNQQLKPTGDRKTAFWEGQKNTYGLLPGRDGTCPGCTEGPGGCAHIAPGRKIPACYVFNTMACYSGVRPVLQHNTDLLKQTAHTSRTSSSDARTIEILKAEFKRFRDTELRHAQKTGTDPMLFYRLHWSGDIFDRNYAACLATAMSAFPDVRFWAYTRTFPIAGDLAENTPNLTLYLSLDKVNFDQGMQTYFDWLHSPHKADNLQICYMSPFNDFPEAYEAAYWRRRIAMALAGGKDGHAEWPAPFSQVELRVCPVDAGKLPLKGGCSKCRMCLNPKPAAVWFMS